MSVHELDIAIMQILVEYRLQNITMSQAMKELKQVFEHYSPLVTSKV